MSTIHQANWWDFNLSNQKDSRWYFDRNLSSDDRRARGFDLIHGYEDEALHQDVIKTKKAEDIVTITANVEPRTVTQLGQDWFLDWMFSLTSSTVDQAVRAAAPLITPSDEIYESFKKVLEYAVLEALFQEQPGLADDNHGCQEEQ